MEDLNGSSQSHGHILLCIPNSMHIYKSWNTPTKQPFTKRKQCGNKTHLHHSHIIATLLFIFIPTNHSMQPSLCASCICLQTVSRWEPISSAKLINRTSGKKRVLRNVEISDTKMSILKRARCSYVSSDQMDKKEERISYNVRVVVCYQIKWKKNISLNVPGFFWWVGKSNGIKAIYLS